MAGPAQQKSRWEAKTQGDVSIFFGVDRRTVADWKLKGMPGGTGRFPLDEIAQWLRRTIQPTHLEAGPDDADTQQRKEAAELAKLEAEAVLADTRARAAIGELIDRATALAMVSQLCAYIRSRLQALPAELAEAIPQTAPADPAAFAALCQRLRANTLDVLEGRVDSILTGMATWHPDHSESTAIPSPPSAADCTSALTSGAASKSSRRKSSRRSSSGAKRKSPPS